MLIWLFLIPFASSLLVFLFPKFLKGYEKAFAFLLSLIPLLLLLFSPERWDGAEIDYAWIPALSVKFHLGLDRYSLIFLYLTAIIIPVSILSYSSKADYHTNAFFSLVLLLQGLLIGFFSARDLVVFMIFWEAMILPLYFIISYWGGIKRGKIALKFLLYMVAGSSLMVAGVLAVYFFAPSANGSSPFDFYSITTAVDSQPQAVWILAIFLLAFCVKTPLFPFHAWLADTYTAAPTAGTILLSAILSKAGIYGILRFGTDLFPETIKLFAPYVLLLAIIGVFYGAFAAWMLQDFKRLIAYSSFSHVNFILAGLFVFSGTAEEGAILQAINHSITIAALFLAAGWLEERLGSTEIGVAGGLCKYMPKLCWFTLVFVLSAIALPGTNSFVGEILILFGLFGAKPILGAILALSVIVSAIYMLRFMQKVYFETPVKARPGFYDLKPQEYITALMFAGAIFWIGLYPSFFLKQIEPQGKKIAMEIPR